MCIKIDVVNIKDVNLDEDGNFYIGRRNNGVLGNPIRLKRGMEKGSTLPAYRRHLWKLWNEEKDGEVWSKLNEIAAYAQEGNDVNLVCHCAPNKCHGDVIKSAIEWLVNGEGEDDE